MTVEEEQQVINSAMGGVDGFTGFLAVYEDRFWHEVKLLGEKVFVAIMDDENVGMAFTIEEVRKFNSEEV